ncbi:MAG: metal-sensitive transcriptional regulator [Cyanobacteria bacterium P01_F01_bin.42]
MDNALKDSGQAKRSHSHGDRSSSHDANHGADHGHAHSEASLKAITNRLSRIEGHIRGVKTMIQEGRPCPDVLIQIAAVRGGLDRVARLILDEHLTECVSRAAQAGNIEEELEELKSALDRFLD